MAPVQRLVTSLFAVLAVLLSSTSAVQASVRTQAATWVPALGVKPGVSTGPLVEVSRAQYAPGVKLVSVRLDGVAGPGSIKHLMFTGILRCGAQNHLVGINVTTGKGSVFLRKIVTDPTNCTAIAVSSMGKSDKDGLRVTATWKAEPVSFYQSTYPGTAQPYLITPGQSSDMVPVRIVLPPKTGHVKVRADFRSTACSVTGGSRENGSDYLCVGKHLNTKGTTFRFRVIAQYGDPGKVCATKVLNTQTVKVDRWLHHAQTYYTGTINRGCSSVIRVKIRVDQVKGASLVAHRQGTASDLWR